MDPWIGVCICPFSPSPCNLCMNKWRVDARMDWGLQKVSRLFQRVWWWCERDVTTSFEQDADSGCLCPPRFSPSPFNLCMNKWRVDAWMDWGLQKVGRLFQRVWWWYERDVTTSFEPDADCGCLCPSPPRFARSLLLLLIYE